MAKDLTAHQRAHDLRNLMNNVSLNLEVAQRLAARSSDARAEELRAHLSVAAAELKKLKQMMEEASKAMG